MANNLRDLVEMIKFSTGEKVEDIAKKVDLSRSHLTVLFNEEKRPAIYDKLYSTYHQKIAKKISESIRIYLPTANEISSAMEPGILYGENTQVQLSLKALKDAVARLEADLSGPRIEESGIDKAAAKADRVSRKNSKSVSDK